MSFYNIICFLIFPILFGCSMYGWGNIFSHTKLSNYISINIVLGMGTTLFFGGLLNFFYLANYLAINTIFLFGLLLFFFKIYKNFHNIKSKRFFEYDKKVYFTLLIPVILLALHILSTTKLSGHNYHDDYQMYFVHPMKMLETGSLYGSTLSSIGQVTLGGQAFFQSFYISWFGIEAINIFDNIFCLCLCVLLIIERSLKQGTPIFGILISCLLILIHPQIVNVSSLYSAVLFMLACIIISVELISDFRKINHSHFKIIFALSICFSSLAILKNSYVLFCFIFFLLLIIFTLISGLFTRKFFNSFISIPLLSLFHLFPWVTSILMNYLDSKKFTNQSMSLNEENLLLRIPNLFSIKPLYLGGNLLQYTILIFLGIGFIILSFYVVKKNNLKFNDLKLEIFVVGFSTLFSGFLIFLLILYVLGPYYFHTSTFIRHSIPFVVATIPIGILLLYVLLFDKFKYASIISSAIILSISLNFLPLYTKRLTQIYKCGSQLSFTKFACSENYMNYNKSVISDKKLLTQSWQEYIPEKKSVMVWINTPFFLNFRRNEIIEIDIAGIDNDWAIFPSAKYMIWEHTGFATRSIKDLKYSQMNGPIIKRRHSIRSLEYIQKIRDMYNKGEIKLILNDKNILIFKFN